MPGVPLRRDPEHAMADTLTTRADDSATSVLIVDDDPGFRRAAAELLSDHGYRVLGQACTAQEASTQCETLRPDAVLLDVRLTGGDGVTLASMLSARSKDLRILLTSTDPMAVSPELLERSGASGFIPKAELAISDFDRFLKG